MRKSLAVTSALAVFLVMLFSVIPLTTASAEADTSGWTFSSADVTANDDGTINIPTNQSAVLNQYINPNDANLDVSVKMAIPFANANQFVSVVLTKDPADLGLDSANTVAHRFVLDGDKYGLNHSWLGTTAVGLYAGGYVSFANGELTVRIKNDNGTVRLYMDDQCIFYGAEHAPIYSDAVKALGGFYLGIVVTSFEGPITAQILEVNGKNPTAPKTYAATDWIVGGEGGVTVNEDGTANVAQGSSVVLKDYINAADANLDVSVKMAIPFANADQFVSVVLTKDPADLGLDSANTVAHRFALDGDKYALNHSWLGTTAVGLYAGGYIPVANGELTVRIKNDNGIVRLYMDDVCIFYGEEHAPIYSDAVKALGGVYLGVVVTSFNGPIAAQILEVNGKNPTGVQPAPELPPVVDETAGEYSAEDWVVGGENNVTVNKDGTANVAQGSTAVLKRLIDLNAEGLDVSVKMAIPFANTSQFVSVVLTKDPADLGLESANTVAHRFALDGDKYALNHSWLNGTATGAYAGGYIPFENGELTVRIKNDNGIVRLYMDDQCIFYGEEHAQIYSDAVKALRGAYLGISVTSFDGPISVQILEVNGKNPTGVEPAPDLPPVVDETDGEYTVEDWVIGGENNVTVNKDGTANVAQGSTAVLKRLIDLNAEGLDVSFKLAIPFANTSQFVSVVLTKDPADLGLESANTIAHRFALDGDKYGLNHSWLNGVATGAYAGGYIPFENGELTVRIKNDNGIVRLYMDDVCIFAGDEHAQIYSDAVKAMRGAYLGIAVTSFDGPIAAQILEVNGKNPTGAQPEPDLPPVVDETDGEYTVEDWVVSDAGVDLNNDGTVSVSVDGKAVLDRLINLNAEGLDVSFKLAIPFANTSQFVSVVLTKDPADLALESTNTIAHRFALEGDKYALNHSWLNGVATGAYAGGYIPFENGEVTVRIKNDNGIVRLYMDDVCIFAGEEHALIYSDAVKAMRGAYLGIAVTSFDGPITAQILEVNGKKPTDKTPPPPKVPATKDEWKNTDAFFNADGSISLGKDDYASLDQVIDMNDPDLDLKWVVNLKDLPHVENADIANFCFYFYNPLSATAPAFDESGASEYYRARFFINDMDVLLYSEVLRGNEIDLQWGQTDLQDYFMWEGEYDVEFRLYNDNGLIRLTANGKQIVPDDACMKNHSDYLKQCGEMYFGMSVAGDATVTLKSFDGVAAYDGNAADTGNDDDDDNDNGGNNGGDNGGNTDTDNGDDTDTDTDTDTDKNPDVPDSGDTSVMAILAALVLVVAAAAGCMLATKKRA